MKGLSGVICARHLTEPLEVFEVQGFVRATQTLRPIRIGAESAWWVPAVVSYHFRYAWDLERTTVEIPANYREGFPARRVTSIELIREALAIGIGD